MDTDIVLVAVSVCEADAVELLEIDTLAVIVVEEVAEEL